MLDAALSTGLPRSVVTRIHEASAGNPFYTLELGRSVVRRGAEHDPSRTLSVPSDLVDLVRDRLSELSQSVRKVLLVISAAFQPTVQLVADAIGDSVAKSDIDAAFKAGVIEGSGGRIRSAHPLLSRVRAG